MKYRIRICGLIAYGLAFAFPSQKLMAQDLLWERSFGGKHADYLHDIKPTADYGFVVAGSSLSDKAGTKSESNNGDMDYWIWKMAEDGNLEWERSFGGTGYDVLRSVTLTADGGFLLAGSSSSGVSEDKSEPSRGSHDYWLIKLDAAGGVQWEKTYGGAGSDQAIVVIESAGGYVIAGTTTSEPSGDKKSKWAGGLDYWIVKIDYEGKMKWEYSYGGIYDDILTDINKTHDGGFIISGYSNSPASGNKTLETLGQGDGWIIRLNRDGEVVWQKLFGGENDDYIAVVQPLKDGGFIVGGHSNSPAGSGRRVSARNGRDMWVFQLDESGEFIWQESFDYGKSDILTSIIQNDDGSFLVSGYARSEVFNQKKKDKKEINDYLALKLNAIGEKKWEKVIGSDGADVLRKTIETRDGGYLLAGTSNGPPSRDRSSGIGRNDFWLVKLLDKEKKRTKPVQIEAIPNPALEFTNVIVGYEFEKGTASLYDLGGRLITSFEVESRTVPINLNGLPEGVYIVQIKTKKSTDSVKIIKGLSSK